MKSIKLISLLFIVLFFGCKKYPEDEKIFLLKKPEGRIWRKKVIIDEYSVNGIDSIPRVNAAIANCCSLDELFMVTVGSSSKGEYRAEIVAGYDGELYYSFTEKNEKLKLRHKISGGFKYPMFFEGENIWDIKRLDNKRFVIEINKNGKHYRVGFKIK